MTTASHPFQLEAVTKRYAAFALGPLDLVAPRGYVTGLVGANGAGKTTAIKIALSAVRPDTGQARLIDKTRVGIVLDRPYWQPDWRVRDVARLLAPFYPGWQQAIFDELADWAGVTPRTRVKDFSRGAGMKMQLAVALAHGAELLVLDEPTSGLDPLARSELLDRLAEFMTDERHAIVFSTHITSDLERIADALVVLDRGKVVASGMRDEVLASWAVVRGPAAALTPEIRGRVRGLREHTVGWEGLLAADALGLCGPGVVAEPPSIEELLVYLAKEERHA